MSLSATGLAALIATRPNSTIMRVLLVVEGAGILLVLLLASRIAIAPGNPVPTAGSGWSPHMLDGVVVAFFSWAGFESCMTLAGASRDPRRDMPAALWISVVASGVLFILVFALMETGFDRMLGGRAALASSANALADLGRAYLGDWSKMAFGIAALCSAFACLVAAASAAGSILASLVGQRGEAAGHRHALRILLPGCVIECAIILLQPNMPALPAQAIGVYALFGGAGAVCIMIAYLLVLTGCLVAIAARRLAVSRIEMLVPLAGLGFILFALLSTVSSGATTSTCIAVAFCAIGFAGLALRRPLFVEEACP